MATLPVCLTIRPENPVITEKIKFSVHHSGDSRVTAEGIWCPPGGATTRGVDLKASIDPDQPVVPTFTVRGYDKIGPPAKSRRLEDMTVIADRYAFLKVVLEGGMSTHLSGTSRIGLSMRITDLCDVLKKQHPNFEQIERCVGCFSTLFEEKLTLPRGEFVDVQKGRAKDLYDKLSACTGVVEDAPDLGDDFASLLATFPFLTKDQLEQVSQVLQPYMKGDAECATNARAMLRELTRVFEIEHITPQMTAPTLRDRVASVASAAASIFTRTLGALRREE